MLPVMIYEPHEKVRAKLLKMLDALSGSASLLRIVASTGSSADLLRYVQAEQGIVLVILGMTRSPEDNREACVQLGQQIMHLNRDSYTLFCVHEMQDLETLLRNCMRPAGILLPPFDAGSFEGCMQRIIEDYSALSGESAEEGYLLLESSSSTYRIPHSQICYLEALDKKLNVCTNRQSVTVRKTLGAVIEELPEQQFLRVHRSYVVNLQYVDHADFSEMSLTLTNGDVLPVSRSCRDALKEHLESAAHRA